MTRVQRAQLLLVELCALQDLQVDNVSGLLVLANETFRTAKALAEEIIEEDQELNFVKE